MLHLGAIRMSAVVIVPVGTSSGGASYFIYLSPGLCLYFLIWCTKEVNKYGHLTHALPITRIFHETGVSGKGRGAGRFANNIPNRQKNIGFHTRP